MSCSDSYAEVTNFMLQPRLSLSKVLKCVLFQKKLSFIGMVTAYEYNIHSFEYHEFRINSGEFCVICYAIQRFIIQKSYVQTQNLYFLTCKLAEKLVTGAYTTREVERNLLFYWSCYKGNFFLFCKSVAQRDFKLLNWALSADRGAERHCQGCH